MLVIGIFLLIICSYTDLRNRSISIKLLAAFLTSSLALMAAVHIFGDRMRIPEGILVYEPGPVSLLAALIPGLIMYAVCRISREAVGMGDVYLISVLGIMFGAVNTFVLIMLSMFMTAMFGMVCMAVNRLNRKSFLPYAPFLLGATVILAGRGFI